MRGILILSVVTCMAISAGAVAVPDKPDLEKTGPDAANADLPRLPLWIQAGGRFSPMGKDLLPAIHVGRMDPKFNFKPLPINDASIACWHDTQNLLRKEDLLVRLANGQETLLPATEDQPITLLVVGPSCDGGESFGPARLTRVGSTFTLLVESWTHNGSFRRNIPHQAIYAVHLGNLKAGTYDLRLLWNEMHCDKTVSSLHHQISSKNGSLKFEVHKGADGANAKTVRLADLAKVDVPAEAKKRAWQRPLFWQRDLGFGDGNFDRIPAAGLRVGALDVPKWLASNPTTVGDVPRLQLPQKDQSLYAVVLGPSLDTGMWMTPRSIEWQDKKVVVSVDVWRDDERRLQNLKHSPLLVASLANTLDLVKLGDYQVAVEWNWLRAPNNREPYITEKLPAEMKFLSERSRQEVSIK